MSQQARSDLNGNPFILSGDSFSRNGITLLQDAGRSEVLAQFTVMGREAVTIPTTGTVTGTGNGTCTAVAAALGGTPIAGDWILTNTLAVAEGGVWSLTDPNGNVVATELAMTEGSGLLTVFVAGGMTFTLTDGGTDFALADIFTITVVANGKWVPFDPAVAGGAGYPRGILMVDDVTAAALVAGDVTDQTMLAGGACTIDSTQVVFDDGSSTMDTVLTGGGTVRDALDAIGIFDEQTEDIAGYEN